MKLFTLVIAVYAIAAGLLIFVYERPAKRRPKITGRGGDFES
jgi:hypothetical protein